MKIALCETKPTPKGKHILRCLGSGFELHGDESFDLFLSDPADDVLEADVAVMVCMPNPADTRTEQMKRRHAIWNRCIPEGIPILILDSGFFQTQADANMSRTDSGDTDESEDDRLIYFQLGWNGFKREALCRQTEVDRFAMLAGVELQDLKPFDPDAPILIMGQTQNGVSCWDVDLNQLYKDLAVRLRKGLNLTNEIRFRQHPRIFRDSRRIKDQAEWARVFRGLRIGFSKQQHIAADLDDVGSVFVYSSNAAAQSILRGIPTFVESRNCVAWSVMNGPWSDFPTCCVPGFPASKPVRVRWARIVASSQWNCAEMADGSAWEHLKKFIPVARSDDGS